MSGNNSFVNNTATEGGAVALLDNSCMFIQNNTEILFLNNYADNVGGAIFVHTILAFDIRFYAQIKYPVISLSNHGLIANITLIFTNNTGRNGGDVANIQCTTLHDYTRYPFTLACIGWLLAGP